MGLAQVIYPDNRDLLSSVILYKTIGSIQPSPPNAPWESSSAQGYHRIDLKQNVLCFWLTAQ